VLRKLHIGGEEVADGWEILNARPGPHVDHVGNANDLSAMSDNTFSAVYASHIVEHLDYRGELVDTLKDWQRVMKPGGTLYVSVPDMDILCQMFLAKDQLPPDARFHVMRMMFGGHSHDYDYHHVGLNQEFLSQFLLAAGFVNVRRVQSLEQFDDTSNMEMAGVRISLNLIAEKPDS